MNVNPLLQHPNRYIWDFWYHYDVAQAVFHVFYLNADPSLVAEEKHHFSSCVGYATTTDFKNINWHQHDVICARSQSWDNTSIWTGDIISVGNQYVMFYTSRNGEKHDGFTQEIGIAFSQDMIQWQRLPKSIAQADSQYYETKSIVGENTIHAWRDPFVFRYREHIYMIVSAKDKYSPKNRKGAIALLKSKSNSFYDWEVLPPLYAPKLYSECEVPRIYTNNGQLFLTFSCKAAFDFSTSTNKGGLYGVALENLEQTTTTEAQLITKQGNLYASIIVPELNGDIVGFDYQHGGLQRLGSDFLGVYLPRLFDSRVLASKK